MPELPEVETVRRGLETHICGARIVGVRLMRPDLRFPFPRDFAARIRGRTIEQAGRRGKYLLFTLSGGLVWLSHLGMTGSYHFVRETIAGKQVHPPSAATRHDHVHMQLDTADGERLELCYRDPRRFGYMDLSEKGEQSAFLTRMGPEPLGNRFDGRYLQSTLLGRRAPIKSLLLDQRIVAGLGNIYVLEALWRSEISPRDAGTDVARSERVCADLVLHIRQVLEEAIDAGGSTLRDFRGADGSSGYFQHKFYVYGRAGETCRRVGCSGVIERLVQGGRSSFFCPVCQPDMS